MKTLIILGIAAIFGWLIKVVGNDFADHNKVRALILITNKLQSQKDATLRLLEKDPHNFNLHFRYDSLNRLDEVIYQPQLAAAQDREDDSD